jgi:hypothetical protein
MSPERLISVGRPGREGGSSDKQTVLRKFQGHKSSYHSKYTLMQSIIVFGLAV